MLLIMLSDKAESLNDVIFTGPYYIQPTRCYLMILFFQQYPVYQVAIVKSANVPHLKWYNINLIFREEYCISCIMVLGACAALLGHKLGQISRIAILIADIGF